MLIWVNGAFGAGKTQVAYELQRRLENSHVADPELLGIAMHKLLPASARGDFQDLPQWRSAVVATLRQAEPANAGPLIVPMTIVRDDYFDEIVGGLRASGVELRHYTLTATPATLRKRLRLRSRYLIGGVLGWDENWAIQQINRCVSALAAERYATQIATDERSVDQIVELIAADAGFELIHSRLSPARHQLRRLEIGLRHIRL